MLIDGLFEHARTRGDAPAIRDDLGVCSHRELANLSLALASKVAEKCKGDHVALMMPSGRYCVAGFIATLLAGKIAVPVNLLLSPKEILHIIKDSGAKLIVSCEPVYGKIRLKLLLKRMIKVEDVARRIAADATEAASSLPQVDGNNVAVMLYTSGSTGLPKGVPLSYNNISSNVTNCIQYAQMNPKQRFFNILPLFHSFGMTANLFVPISLGAEVIHHAKFAPLKVIQDIREHRASIMMMVPSLYAALLKVRNAGAEDFASVELALSGGEPLPRALADQFKERFNVELLEGYGLTETSPVVAINVPWASKPRTVGKPIPDQQVRIVDDQGADTRSGEEGEIWLSGPNVCGGYHRQPEQTAEAFTPDGWFKTGDFGRMDDEGYLTISGRKKDMLIISGENVFPREIEDVLSQHEAVAETAVIGVHDTQRGELPVAFVICQEGADVDEMSLRHFCRDKIASFKVPREIHFVSDFPRTPAGKILKRQLQQQLAT